MNRHFALFGLAALMCVAAASAAAHTGPPPPVLIGPVAVALPPDLQGVVHDDRGQPVAGAVVSALGTTAASVVSDARGRFAFRNLPEGPYLVRVHLAGIPAGSLATGAGETRARCRADRHADAAWR